MVIKMGTPKLTDVDAVDSAEKHLRAAFAECVKLELGPNPSGLRLDVYRKAFARVIATMEGEERRRFEFYGQISALIPPPSAAEGW